MRWPWRRGPAPDGPECKHQDAAEDRVRSLEERAGRVARALEERQRRNHWAEAIAAIYNPEGRS